MQDNNRLFIFLMLLAAVILAIVFSVIDAKLATAGVVDARQVLVIDPGHGGEDGGAVCGEIRESVLNLQISKKLATLCELLSLDYQLTRESETIEYPEELTKTAARKVFDQKRRLEIANSVPGAALISVHQNKYPAASPRGPQAFFGKTGGSEELAKLLQTALNTQLYPENRRIAVKIPESIFLMKNAKCPAVLVECGFISNPAEAALLQNGGYQTKLALCMISSYCMYIGNTFLS